MTLAIPLALSLLLSAPPKPAPTVDWSRIPESVGAAALTPQQKDVLARVLADEFCYCGCPHTLLGCLTEHTQCTHAPRMAALAARLAGMGLSANEVLKTLTEYYASFDKSKRSRFEINALGVPIGDPKAPVVIYEYADFECPFCQQLRPKLEAFVKRNPGRVKLVFRPFPIPGHPNAETAAEAAEWARDQGIFWPFHDAMFDNPKKLDVESLVLLADKLGKDGESLRQALADRKYRDRVQSGLIEGRRAGVAGTPTIFWNGRRHVIPDYSDTVLEFALEDEEEWLRRGWKD
ncbi:MAG TPA: thioredoxin domain-containing protein [Anaeromyxobacteraceae bacterium]|nr:thioredoxin domain-containing protein [Anaeromyxobacteraceae bacterium]